MTKLLRVNDAAVLSPGFATATRVLLTGTIASFGRFVARYAPSVRGPRASSSAQRFSLRRATFCVALLTLPAVAGANVWKESFGQQWFYAKAANAGQLMAGAWWERRLTPGNTYTISFRVTQLNGAIGLYVGGRPIIRIDRTGRYTFDFAVGNDTPRRLAFTSLRSNTTAGVNEIIVLAAGSGSGGSGSDSDPVSSGSTTSGNAMPKGHYLTFSRPRNIEKEMLNYIDRPGSAPSSWHMGIARDMHDALTMRAVKGFSVHVPWRQIETGDNRYSWALLDANMQVARRLKKKFIVKIETRTFDGSNPVPAYFPNHQSVWSGNGYTARLWDPWVSDRLVRLHQRIIERYGRDSAFGGIASTETAVGNLKGGNYSLGSYRNALIKIANRTQSALRKAGNGRFFWYLNYVLGGDSANMRQDVRINMLKNDVQNYALAVGGPDVTPDARGMPGSMNAYRIYARKTMKHIDQFCHQQHVDQGQGGTNRKSNRWRKEYQDRVNQWRQREQQSWFSGQPAIFEFSDLHFGQGSPVEMHPSWALNQLWHPSELFDFANRNFHCDYFFWHYRENVHNRQDQFWWEDIQPIIRNNEYFYRQ